MNRPEYYKEATYRINQIHHTQRYLPPVVSNRDRDTLRELGEKIAGIGSLPVQQGKKKMWASLNQLHGSRPMVWVDEICWNEMDVDDALKLHTTSPFCQRIEAELRQTLYQWEHLPGDMVVEPVVYSPLVITNSGIGISIDENTVKKYQDSTVASHQYHAQIKNEEDIEKIKMPEITHDDKKSAENYQAYRYIFDGVLNVEKRGVPGFWFAPWDDLIRFTGVQEALIDLALRPEYIHKLVERFVTAYLHSLEQYERLGLLSLNSSNVRIGSGGYGCTGELPEAGNNTGRVATKDMWGSAAAQIFVGVSPKMHEEFALKYEKRWLERFGLVYYGCCEPLHKKIDMLRSIPNLRKISISPWADIEEAAKQISGDYILSLKPSPAILARDDWDIQRARFELEERLKPAKKYGCNVEIIMKDITTVRKDPRRLWEWTKMATEIAEIYAGQVA